MAIKGHCSCRNFEIHWHTVDFSLVPRACECQFCRSRRLSYVSKSGTRVNILLHNAESHRVLRQGSESASFHQCTHCGDIVFVTAVIEGELYCALNTAVLNNPLGFAPAIPMTLFDQPAAEKLRRWQLNWCHPVSIKGMVQDRVGTDGNV